MPSFDGSVFLEPKRLKLLGFSHWDIKCFCKYDGSSSVVGEVDSLLSVVILNVALFRYVTKE